MDAFYRKLAELAGSLPPDLMEALATAVGRLETLAGYPAAATSALGSSAMAGRLPVSFAEAVSGSKLSPAELAAAIRAAAVTASLERARSNIQVIWTGPATTAVPVRMTERALCDLVDLAEKTLFVVSFVAIRADRVYEKISAAVARGVRVSLLTESSKEHGGQLDDDPINRLRRIIPGATFYRWSAKANISAGRVHAKCAIADRKAALITSANLTEAAMENNMELGLLVEDNRLAGRLADHFAALATEKIIERV